MCEKPRVGFRYCFLPLIMSQVAHPSTHAFAPRIEAIIPQLDCKLPLALLFSLILERVKSRSKESESATHTCGTVHTSKCLDSSQLSSGTLKTTTRVQALTMNHLSGSGSDSRVTEMYRHIIASQPDLLIRTRSLSVSLCLQSSPL
jgi:hypothetical protein